MGSVAGEKKQPIRFFETIKTHHLELMRKIARKECERQTGEIKTFMDDLETQIRNWQGRK